MEKKENPVVNKRFFLEIKNSPQLLKTITDCIKQLNGRTESFLNSTVNYVVTNRPKAEWPQKTELQSSTSSIINPNAAFSRASKMLQSTQNVPKTTDPLEMARKFGKKIIFANELLEFLKKHIQDLYPDDKSQNASETNSRRLNPPFIKVVDNSFKYKTNFKELNEWPEINYEFQPELCPFYKPKKPSLSTNVSQQSNKSVVMQGRPNDKFQTVLTTPILTTPTVNIRSIPTRNASKRKHMTFCEICHKEYEDFERHLNDETHAKFLTNDNNFNELFSVIKSLPPFLNHPVHIFNNTRTNNKSFTDISNVIPIFEHISPQNSQQSPNENVVTRKLPSPLMRSIQLRNTWDSKQCFMAIHELVNDDENINAHNQSVKEHASPTLEAKSLQEDFENIENNKPLILDNESALGPTLGYHS